MPSDAAWSEAVAREAVIRRLISLERPGRSDFQRACHELGMRRTRLYELIRAYRERPVTSSLLARPAGTRQGSRRLPEQAEAVIAEAIRDLYKSRQKPSVNRLHKEVWRLCAARGFPCPSWHAVRARISALDPAEVVRAREGPKAARDRFGPVPGEYRAEYPFEVVQIDHTLVDVIVVDRQTRQPLQRPWLTLAVDVASRMVAGFHLKDAGLLGAASRELGRAGLAPGSHTGDALPDEAGLLADLAGVLDLEAEEDEPEEDAA